MKKLLFYFSLLTATMGCAPVPALSQITQQQTDSYWSGTATGTNTYAVTISKITSTVPYNFQTIKVRFANANTGASTIAVNSYSAIGITLNGSALVGGEIIAAASYILVYNSTTTKWELQPYMAGSGAASAWKITGNASTVAGTNFLGTTDAQDVVFKRNSSEVMRLYSASNYVGIGTATPTTKFHVQSGQSTLTFDDGSANSTLIIRSINSEGGSSFISYQDVGGSERWKIGREYNGVDPFHLYSNAFTINNHEFSSSARLFTPLLIDTNSKIIMGRNSANLEDDLSTPIADVSVFTANSTTGSGNLFVCATDAMAINKGGSISFGGSIGNSYPSTASQFAAISGRKTNGTGGQSQGYMSFYTSNSGGTLSEKMRITTGGDVGINQTVPDARLHIEGSSGTTIKIVDGNQGLNKVLTSDANGQGSWVTPNVANMTGILPIVNGGTASSIATGSGAVVLATSPTISTPSISATDWSNANHTHAGATTGGQITTAALSDYVGWTDYSATTTVVGFSSLGSKVVIYSKIGKVVFVQFAFNGTSNATNFTFTIPFTTVAGTSISNSCSFGTDNSVDLAVAPSVFASANSSTITIYKSPTLNAWTGSGSKGAQGFITIFVQ